jgi:hypothetical protein
MKSRSALRLTSGQHGADAVRWKVHLLAAERPAAKEEQGGEDAGLNAVQEHNKHDSNRRRRTQAEALEPGTPRRFWTPHLENRKRNVSNKTQSSGQRCKRAQEEPAAMLTELLGQTLDVAEQIRLHVKLCPRKRKT